MALESITSKIPDIGVGFGDVLNVFAWLMIIFVCGSAAGIITFILMRNKKFNKKIVVFEKVSGRFEPAYSVRAMITRLGESGDNVLFCAKIKKYLPTPTIQTGRNVYWFFVREDGEWINAGIEDFDKKSGEMNVYFLDKEMRYQRAALQKNLKERYAKLTFLEKYGGLMVWTVLCLVLMVGFVLLADKLVSVTGAVENLIKTATAVMEKSDAVISKLDNVCGGSGIKTAG
jgi:hypothetical protein